MKISRHSAALMSRFVTVLAIVAAGPQCWAVFVYFDGSTSTDFHVATNWAPENAPGTNLVDIYSIDDGLSSTFFGGSTTIWGLRVGSVAKEHQFGDTHFGRLTMTDGSLEVIGSNVLVVGRERENAFFGGDYNKNSVVDAADYVVWRKTLGSMSVLNADGDGNGTIQQADYDFWKARFGNVVKGGELILNGTSTLKANGALIGERTLGLLEIGPDAAVDIRIWDTTVIPNQFGGTEDMRVGGYGPAYDDFGGEPGLDGRGLVDLQGTLNAKVLYLSEHGGKGELRVSGGTVNLNGELIMDFCGNCVTDPGLLSQRSAKVSIIGSSGTFNVGLDPDPLVVDPMPPNRDLLAASPTATFSFTADVGGVTPITIVENVDEPSGTAEIEGARLELNLDAYPFTPTSTLTLIDAPPGNLLGEFDPVWTFLGTTTADVNYDPFNGNVYLDNFQSGAGAGTGPLTGSTVPEPTGLIMGTLALGLLLLFSNSRAKRQTACLWGNPWLKVRA